MKTLDIYMNSMKQYLLSIKFYIVLYLIIPLVMSYAYGLIYKNITDENSTLPKFTVAYINNDTGSISNSLKGIFDNKKISNIVALKSLSSSGDINSKLTDGTYSAAIIIPENFSSNITEGKSTSIEVLKAPNAGAGGDFIEAIVSAYSKNVNVNRAVYSVLLTNTKSANQTQEIFNRVLPQITAILNKSYVQYDNLAKTKKINSSQDFAANMLIMFSLFISMSAATTILLEHENGTLNRIASTSASKFNYCFGRLSAVFTISIIQITMFIIVSSLVSGVDWGNKLSMAVNIIVHSLIIVGITSILMGLFKDQKKMNVSASLIFIIMSMLSGAMNPSEYIVGTFKTISHFSINFWIKACYTNNMLGDSLSTTGTSLLVLVLIAMVLIATGSLSYKYTE